MRNMLGGITLSLGLLCGTALAAPSALPHTEVLAKPRLCSPVTCPSPQWVELGSLADELPDLDVANCDYRLRNENIAGGGMYFLPSSTHSSGIYQNGNLLTYQILKFNLDLRDLMFASFVDTQKFRDAINAYRNAPHSPKDLNLEVRVGAYQSVSYSIDWADEQGLIQGSGLGILNDQVKSRLLVEERCM